MRLINADAIELRYTIGVIADDGIVCVPLKDVRKSIDETPTVDAVPVVRCKDCKHYDSHGRLICTLHSLEESENCIGANVYMLPDDFCSYGERKEDV